MRQPDICNSMATHTGRSAALSRMTDGGSAAASESRNSSDSKIQKLYDACIEAFRPSIFDCEHTEPARDKLKRVNDVLGKTRYHVSNHCMVIVSFEAYVCVAHDLHLFVVDRFFNAFNCLICMWRTCR